MKSRSPARLETVATKLLHLRPRWPRLRRGLAEGSLGTDLKMLAADSVLPEPFARTRAQSRRARATGSDRGDRRMASLRTATPRRAAFAECKAEDAHALFAKLARVRRSGLDSVPRRDRSRVNIASTCFRPA